MAAGDQLELESDTEDKAETDSTSGDIVLLEAAAAGGGIPVLDQGMLVGGLTEMYGGLN